MMLVLEEVHIPMWFFPYNTSYEIVSMAKRIFPAFMNGTRCIYSAFYEDTKTVRVIHLTELTTAMKITTLKLSSVMKNVLNTQALCFSSDFNKEKEGLVAAALSSQHGSNSMKHEAAKLVQAKIDLIKDPKLLRKHDNHDRNFEFFRNILCFLVARYLHQNFKGTA